MSRRSTPQKTLDDRRYPIAIYFWLPELGLSAIRIDPHGWLQKNLGTGQHAIHSGGRPGRETFVVYFRRVADLAAFMEAHPMLELADDVRAD